VEIILPIREIACHVGSHSVTCQAAPGSGDFPTFTQAEAVTRFSDPGWWLHPKIVYPPMTVTHLRNNRAVSWLGNEPATERRKFDILTTEPARVEFLSTISGYCCCEMVRQLILSRQTATHKRLVHSDNTYEPGFPRILESPWKYLKTGQVLESPWISFYRSLKALEFTKSNCAISATSLNNISIWLKCILIHLTWSSYNSTQYSLLTYKISQPTEN